MRAVFVIHGVISCHEDLQNCFISFYLRSFFYLSSEIQPLWNVECCNRNMAMAKIHAENMQNSIEKSLTLENSLRSMPRTLAHTPISKYFIYNYWISYVCACILHLHHRHCHHDNDDGIKCERHKKKANKKGKKERR